MIQFLLTKKIKKKKKKKERIYKMETLKNFVV